MDWTESAVETYKLNIGQHVLKQDLSAGFDAPSCSVIVGGPPCQGFSSAGLRRAGDQRNSLVNQFAALVERVRPLAFVFENVEGFLTAEDGRHVFELLDPLIACGYRIHVRKVNAANYGLPQHRKRVLAIGGLGWDPTTPEPTSAPSAPQARDRLTSTCHERKHWPKLLRTYQRRPWHRQAFLKDTIIDHWRERISRERSP